MMTAVNFRERDWNSSSHLIPHFYWLLQMVGRLQHPHSENNINSVKFHISQDYF